MKAAVPAESYVIYSSFFIILSLLRCLREIKKICYSLRYHNKNVIINIYLSKGTWEMITILIHKMVTISPEILSKLCNYSLHIVFCKVCVPNMNRLPIKIIQQIMLEYKVPKYEDYEYSEEKNWRTNSYTKIISQETSKVGDTKWHNRNLKYYNNNFKKFVRVTSSSADESHCAGWKLHFIFFFIVICTLQRSLQIVARQVLLYFLPFNIIFINWLSISYRNWFVTQYITYLNIWSWVDNEDEVFESALHIFK